MIFLFEGVDKTGKTTLSTMFAEKMGFQYRKHSTMKSSVDAALAAQKVLVDLTTHKNYVFDRFYFPSDLIYGPIVGGYQHSWFIMALYKGMIVPTMLEYDVVFIHCTASDEVLAERFIRDEEEYASVGQIQAIASEYRSFAKMGPFSKVITLDSTTTPTEELYNQLIAQLTAWGVMK